MSLEATHARALAGPAADDQSVTKHCQAYVDVPWDDPEFAIDPADPRFELGLITPPYSAVWQRPGILRS